MRRLAVSILALFAIAVPALAQEEPPARVGRVSFLSGQLGFHAAGETQWSAAAINYPVATGGSFWTDPQSRAEIRIGAQTIDLSNDTEVDITRLNQQVMQITVPQGRINLHLRNLPEGNTVEIDIPRGGVWLLQPGIYDIAAGTQDQPSRIAVFEGSARFVGGPIDLGIKTGDAAVISGWDTLTATLERATPDAFVEWSRSRDYHEQRLAAPYYVSPAMTGYEELDEYGAWGSAPDYGEVWYPNSVPAGWAPYREGHWVWIDPWGWTWVDDAPWGFAPFHYGRWAFIGQRWGWIPGRFVPQPVYAPALVAFIGIGPAVGWFPLGPNEVYWPSYTRNPAYIRNLNIANVSEARIRNFTTATGNRPTASPPPQVVNQSFANRGAATVVPVQTFTNAAKVAPAALHVAPQTLQQAPVSARPPQVTPTAARVAPAQPAAAPAAAAPGAHPAGASTVTAPAGAPGAHPPGVSSATAPPGAPGAHPPGATVPSAATPTPPAAAPAAPSHPAAALPPPHPAAAPAAPPHPAAVFAPPPHQAPPPAAPPHPAAAPAAPPHPAGAPAAPPHGGPPGKGEPKQDEPK